MNWILALIVLGITAYMLIDCLYGVYDMFKNWDKNHGNED